MFTLHIYAPLGVQTLKALQDEATERGFTSSEISDELQTTLHDVQRCIDTALQITAGRGRGRAGNKVLDVGGLKEFLEQVESLPCHLPEADAIRVSGSKQYVILSLLKDTLLVPTMIILSLLIYTASG